MKNKFKPILSVLLVLTMLLGLLAAFPLTTSAAINAVWWTDASNNTNFTASIDTEWVSSSSWYCLCKYDEASERYVQVQGGYAVGCVGTRTLVDFEKVIRQNGSGKYKVEIDTTSGTTYESAEKTYTFEGALDAPQNLRWVGESVRWEPVEGADRYDITLRYKKNESSDQIWSTSYTYGNTYSVDFSGQLSNPGSYYFTVEASSEDEMLVSSSAKSPEKTVSYTYSDLNAHWGDVSRDQRKYMLYWNNVPDATGYYMVLSKKNGEAYQPVSGFDNKLSKLTGLDLYAVMEANGEGNYQVDFFAFNTSPTIPVSNEVSIEITFTNCEHSYTKKIQESYYLHSESSDCTTNTEYYYACEHCGEMAPKEAQYVYEGDIVKHDMIEEYQANGKAHWHGCSKCDYVEHHQPHTLDENNYCETCDTTVYEIWVGDTQITSKNCDDIFGDGSAFYMPELNRLILTNYTDPDSRREGITVIDPDSGNDYVAMIYAKNGLTLHLRGENFLYEDAGDIGRQYGVVVENGDLKIEGSGSLFANATVGFYTMDGDIYIDKNGGLLDVVGYYAIQCEYHKLYINDGKVKLRSHAGHVYSSAPVLDNYYGGCYYAEISNDYDGDDPEAYRPTTNIKYFYIESARMVTIMPAEGEGETIFQTVRKGEKYTFPECPYTAPAGKQFYRWYLDSWTNKGERVAGETITITEDITITPVWTDKTLYTITATAGEHGWITPVGEVSVIEGGNQRFTVSPDAGNGYRIKDIKVNGVSVGTNPYYTFENVTANATIEVEFELSDTVLEATYNGTILAGNKITPENIQITTHHVSNPMVKTPVSAGDVQYWYNGEQITDPVNFVFGADLIGNLRITVTYEGVETTMLVKVVGHEITFNANGGTGTMDGTQYVGVYTLPTYTDFEAPAGKQFKGWALATNGAVIEGATYNVTEPIELFAVWEDIPHTHTHSTTWESDANNHWNECACGDKANVAAHADGNSDGKCDTCAYQLSTTPGGSGSQESEPPEKEKGLGAGAIVGIVIGSVAVAGIGGFAIFWFVIKKKSWADLVAVFKKK
ncbi:MAG: hypothetical protein E7590_09705 [Ruminococcaceae bacterium]|nr:hypothetical protein [Oscillospiraceae bacterium]